ncbi:MAG: TlpA family protein disulfide reductase [Phycisphaeraceae bacterium]|nr:TlpA family protein disulfide reductase [Phycisphaeraceae bacterium]MBX3407873.1 TlpA family protein disulfide reductase [Phycisphaeraceae bacterium]
MTRTCRTSVALVASSLALAGIASAAMHAQPPSPPAAVPAPPPALDINSPAPRLFIRQWVRGDPVEALEPGKVSVVVFWATWCQPCRRAVPYLSDIQRTHADRGLRIIAIASQEPGGADDLERFALQQGDRVAYSIAWDDQGRTHRAWIAASGSRAIPTAFIVDQRGRIAWIGSPQAGLARAVAQVLDGTFDIAAEAAEAARRREIAASAAPLAREFHNATRAGDFPAAIRAADRIIELDPVLNSEWSIAKVQVLLSQMKDPERAFAFAAAAADGPLKDNPDALVNLALLIAEEPGPNSRDFPLALRAAQRAVEITAERDPTVLAALAQTQAAAGQAAAAARTQERAVDLSAPGPEREEQRRRLDEYKKKLN